MARIPVLILLALLVLALPAAAQQADAGDGEPEEYEEEEFSPILRDLRRAEIVMFGSFPITLFLTLEAFDIYRYIDHYGDSDVYRYTPWPYRSPDPAPYSSGEIAGILVTAVSASMLIAAADYIIGKAKEKRSER
jgi:hypothetical protein